MQRRVCAAITAMWPVSADAASGYQRPTSTNAHVATMTGRREYGPLPAPLLRSADTGVDAVGEVQYGMTRRCGQPGCRKQILAAAHQTRVP